MRLLLNTNCYYCGNNSSTPVYSIKGFRDDQRLFNIVKCDVCSLVYINPRYSEKENFELYQKDYFTKTAVDPSGNIRSFMSDKLRKINDHKIEVGYIKKFKKKGSILDFGSATGFFLEALDGDWDKYAVDISKFAIKNIEDPKVNTFHGTLIDAGYQDHFFDVIYIGHTLDRIINIKDIIIELKRILKHDGIIVVTLPNIDSICAKIFKSNFRLLYSNHLIYFSPQTLRNFFEDIGFSIITLKYPYFKTSFFSYSGLLKGMAKIVNQLLLNTFLGTQVKYSSPPFWGNIMCAIIKKK